MFELVKAGGWLMLPIIACSVISMAIVVERFWSLQSKRVLPDNMLPDIWKWSRENKLNEDRIREIRISSPLGRVLAAGLQNSARDRDIMRDSIEEVGRHVAHELERFLNALGTIAAVTPLLGLLGTVVGMISVFTTITTVGVGDPAELAGGISQALITTAAGLVVAIPSLMFARYFRARVDTLVVGMEQEAIKLVEVMYHSRNQGGQTRASKGAKK